MAAGRSESGGTPSDREVAESGLNVGAFHVSSL